MEKAKTASSFPFIARRLCVGDNDGNPPNVLRRSKLRLTYPSERLARRSQVHEDQPLIGNQITQHPAVAKDIKRLAILRVPRLATRDLGQQQPQSDDALTCKHLNREGSVNRQRRTDRQLVGIMEICKQRR